MKPRFLSDNGTSHQLNRFLCFLSDVLVSRNCCVTLPRGAMNLSAVCDFGISLLYSLTIFNSPEGAEHVQIRILKGMDF